MAFAVVDFAVIAFHSVGDSRLAQPVAKDWRVEKFAGKWFVDRYHNRSESSNAYVEAQPDIQEDRNARPLLISEKLGVEPFFCFLMKSGLNAIAGYQIPSGAELDWLSWKLSSFAFGYSRLL
jgi:hypothetical protein